MSSQKQVAPAGRRGIALLVTTAMSIVLFPMVGLSVDVALLYTIKTKLSAAADAAALAGARSLSRGNDPGTQTVNAQTTATNYFRANFPVNYFSTTASAINTTVTIQANLRIVESTATATAPIYFLRMLANAGPTVNVSVSATAERRDSNIVIVMDRSGSLQNSGSCNPMKAAAAGFVDKFAEGTDFLGLVTFAGSSYYMDYPISTNFKTSAPSLPTIITNNVNCNGATSSAHGLWNGYTALADLGQPGALNVIVFFTDGQPTALPGTFPIKATSPCPNVITPRVATMTMAGVAGSRNPWGLIAMTNGVVPVTTDNNVTNPGGINSTCQFVTTAATSVATDVESIPATDYFGDNTTSGYASPVTLAMGASADTNGASIQNAAVNVADEAAKHIRNGDGITAVTPGAPVSAVGKSMADVVIFSIGLGNAGAPPDEVLLKRIANTTDSTSYDSTKTAGIYVFAQTAADLDDAFKKVAAEILRLSK